MCVVISSSGGSELMTLPNNGDGGMDIINLVGMNVRIPLDIPFRIREEEKPQMAHCEDNNFDCVRPKRIMLQNR